MKVRRTSLLLLICYTAAAFAFTLNRAHQATVPFTIKRIIYSSSKAAPLFNSNTDGLETPPKAGPVDGSAEEDVVVYVGNLSFDLSPDRIRELFEPFGTVTQVNYPRNRDTGTGRGFAFVNMPNREEAAKAIEALNESVIEGRTTYVNEAGEKSSRPARDRQEWTKFYVGNVSIESSEQDLMEYFEQFGSVHNCFIPTDKESGRTRGFAYVTMNADDAKVVIEKDDGHGLGEKLLTVEKALPKGEKAKERRGNTEANGTKLYVGNLPFNLELSIVRALFESYGVVTDCIIPLDRKTGKSRGFAFVTFASHEDAEKAVMEMNEHVLEGRALRVNEAQPMK